MKYESHHKIGDVAYFQPSIKKIEWSEEKKTYLIGHGSVPVKIVGVSFIAGKVFYDIALPYGDGGFYEQNPLFRVDSYLIHKASSVPEGEA